MSDEPTKPDGVEFFPIVAPFEISAADLEAARAFGEGVRARHDQALAEMRQREDESVFDNAMAVMRPIGDQPPLPPQHRILEHRTTSGERMLLLVPEPEFISVPPFAWPSPAPSPFEFVPHQRLGGCITWPDPMRIACTATPMPTAPGVEAMLADGWVWTGWHFARDQAPRWRWANASIVEVEDEPASEDVFMRVGPPGDPRVGKFRGDDAGGEARLVPGKRWIKVWHDDHGLRGKIGRWDVVRPRATASRITEHRVVAGRYADRLPTNRRRKRERAKARRRANRRTAS